jgi:hypothetical protein
VHPLEGFTAEKKGPTSAGWAGGSNPRRRVGRQGIGHNRPEPLVRNLVALTLIEGQGARSHVICHDRVDAQMCPSMLAGEAGLASEVSHGLPIFGEGYTWRSNVNDLAANTFCLIIRRCSRRDVDRIIAVEHGRTALADPFVFSQRLVAD